MGGTLGERGLEQGGIVSIIHVVSVSGGKDSEATMLIALERFGKHRCRFVFADTGNEDEAVYQHLAYLEQALDIEIVRLKADFSEQIAAKRIFIARDMRTGRKYDEVIVTDPDGTPVQKRDSAGNPVFKANKKGELKPVWKTKKIGGGRRVRWTNKAKRRALSVLYPTGIPFLDLCLWKGRFPSRMSQFCTEQLKTLPVAEYQLNLIDEGNSVVSWQGVRRDESTNRKDALKFESRGGGLYIYRPIVDLTAQQTVNFCLSRGVMLNPLYSEGFGRVGCMLCVNANKEEVSNCSDRKPHHIDRLGRWEVKVSMASKRGFSTFFHKGPGEAPGGLTNREIFELANIWQTVRWAKTARGGRQATFEFERPACASSYGLCE